MNEPALTCFLCQVGLDGSMPVGVTGGVGVSSSGEALVFGDAAGVVHLWADRADARVNAYSEHQEPLPPALPEELPIEFDQTTSVLLESGLPDAVCLPRSHCRSPLAVLSPLDSMDGTAFLSTWTGERDAALFLLTHGCSVPARCSDTTTFVPAKMATPIDPSLVPELKWNDFIGYAPHPGGGFVRNHAASFARYTASRK